VTLARRRALVGIENDPNAPAQLRQLVRLARLATLTGKRGKPDYAGAFRAIGPAAIKLGQSLATRPDLVGEEAANNLLSLQDSLPPVPFAQIQAAIESSFGQPISALFTAIDPEPVGAASIAQVHKGVTTDGRTVAIKVLRPGIREKFARDIQTYEWAAAHVEAMGGEASRLRPRLTIANFKRWTNSELDLRREAASASELAEQLAGVPGYRIPAEFNKTPHEPGVLSMARTNDPNSAGSQFFICLERVPHLDNQYTAFGRTADQASLDVVKAIGNVRTGGGDRPVEPVVIKKATVKRIPKQ
jgi:ubiquinone biosynthesis protein